MRFEGAKSSRIDAKGRMPVPAVYRSKLDPDGECPLVLTRGFDDCLSLYPRSVWDRVQNAIYATEGRRYTNRRVRRFMRGLNANTVTVPLDPQGRILIPERLRKRAGLKSEALVIGMGDWMEIWDPERYEQYEADDTDGTFDELQERFMERALEHRDGNPAGASQEGGAMPAERDGGERMETGDPSPGEETLP